MNDNNQAISDDQELAKVLSGVQQQTRNMATSDPENHDAPGLSYEETPAPGAPAANSAPTSEAPADTSPAAPQPEPTLAAPAVPVSSALEDIKKEALEELRPLVDKLELPAKEKFDTLLLIIRSTDDQSLLGAAHEAAKAIEDETDRAEALLDIVKEIDYFAGQKAV